MPNDNHVPLTRIAFTSEKCLVILSREVHIVIGEGLLLRRFLESHVFGTAEQVERISPDLTFRHWLTLGDISLNTLYQLFIVKYLINTNTQDSKLAWITDV